MQGVVASRRPAVARAKVGLQEQKILIRLRGAQLRDELGALPVRHLAVVQRYLDQHGGIIFCRDVVVRRVANHVVKSGLLVRISPLDVFAGGERQGCIQHGIDHIHERDLRDHRFE